MLVIQHLESNESTHTFKILHAQGGAQGEEVTLPDPDSFSVDNHPAPPLTTELAWYLEEFPSNPSAPHTERADALLRVRKKWGEACFFALFGSGKAHHWYETFYDRGLEKLTLQISSDDPQIWRWPWETLQDSYGVPLIYRCHIQRQPSTPAPPLPQNLYPQDRLHILLIISRPDGDETGYHILSRHLLELCREQSSPIHVTRLYPPTLECLRTLLKERPGYFHLLHFDGHGDVKPPPHNPASSKKSLPTPMGNLIFEQDDTQPDPVSAERLAALLAEYPIPILWMYATRPHTHAHEAFASVATTVMKVGVSSVVMGYTLMERSAKLFISAFHTRLFQSGVLAEAVRTGRQAMFIHPARTCCQGSFFLQDWMVPTLYQQTPINLTFHPSPHPSPTTDPTYPEEARFTGRYGFMGRAGALLHLERALRREKPGAILIHGLAGVGKTTLVQGFLRWLQDSDRLHTKVLWSDFEEVDSAGTLIQRLTEALFTTDTIPSEENQDQAVAEALRQNPRLLVWDNIESAFGMPDRGGEASWTTRDQERLAALLHTLHGTQSKALLISRTSEPWLPDQTCTRLPLKGLDGESRWAYGNALIADLRLALDQEKKSYATLMEASNGHPLAMRAIMLRLDQLKDSTKLLKIWHQAFTKGREGNEDAQHLLTALKLFDQGLDPTFRPLLQRIGLHRKFVERGLLEQMASSFLEEKTQADPITPCLTALERGGLLLPLKQNLYAIHPVLLMHLTQNHPAGECAQRHFVQAMATLAQGVTPKEQYEQSDLFCLFSASLRQARLLAENQGMQQEKTAITETLAAFSRNKEAFVAAHDLNTGIPHQEEQQGQAEQADQADQVNQKNQEEIKSQGSTEILKVLEVQENQESQDLLSYYQQGKAAEEQHDYPVAELWYKKSLEIEERLENEYGVASTLHQLGVIAAKQHNFPTAEHCYKKSLEISEQLGNEHGIASTYHQLGIIIAKRSDHTHAEHYYKKSLEISERLGIEHCAAGTYHQLGIIAAKRCDYPIAERWYKKSLEIKERTNNEHGAAMTYHQLGIIAGEQHDHQNAERWYKKSLEIEERLGNKHGAARTQAVLGFLYQEQGNTVTAAHWQIQAIRGFIDSQDKALEQAAIEGFMETVQAANESTRLEILTAWEAAGLDSTLNRKQLLERLKESSTSKAAQVSQEQHLDEKQEESSQREETPPIHRPRSRLWGWALQWIKGRNG